MTSTNTTTPRFVCVAAVEGHGAEGAHMLGAGRFHLPGHIKDEINRCARTNNAGSYYWTTLDIPRLMVLVRGLGGYAVGTGPGRTSYRVPRKLSPAAIKRTMAALAKHDAD